MSTCWRLFLGLLTVFIKYSTSQKCSTLTSVLPETLGAHQAIYSSLSNAVYIFGGRGGVGNIVYKWDLNVANSWFEAIDTTPTNPFWSNTQQSVLITDTVYFVGIRDNYPIVTGSIYRYYIPTESWLNTLELAPMTHPMDFGCLSTNQSHLFIFEGSDDVDGDSSGHPYLQIYDISNNIWITRSLNSTYGWRYQYCSFVNNNLFIFGGFNSKDTMYRYDMDQQRLVNIGQLPSTFYKGRAVSHNNLLYLVGREPFDTKIPIFNVNTELLTNECIEMNINVSRAASLILNDTLYIFGGWIVGRTDKVQVCQLNETISPCYPTVTPTANPTPLSPVTSLPTTYAPTMTTQTSPNPTDNPTDQPTPQQTTLSPVTLHPANTTVTSLPTINVPTNQADNSTNQSTTQPANNSTKRPTNQPTSQLTSTKTPFAASTQYSTTIKPLESKPVTLYSTETNVFESFNPNDTSKQSLISILSIVGSVIGCCVLISCIVIIYKIRVKTKHQTDEEYMQSDKVAVGTYNMQSNELRKIKKVKRNVEMANLRRNDVMMDGNTQIGNNIASTGGNDDDIAIDDFVIAVTTHDTKGGFIEGGGELVDNNYQDFIQNQQLQEYITPQMSSDEFIVENDDRTRQFSEGV